MEDWYYQNGSTAINKEFTYLPYCSVDCILSLSITVASCIGIANGQSPGAGTSTFNTTHVTNIQNAILTNYLTNTRPSDQVVLQIGFGVHHITKLVKFFVLF